VFSCLQYWLSNVWRAEFWAPLDVDLSRTLHSVIIKAVSPITPADTDRKFMRWSTACDSLATAQIWGAEGVSWPSLLKLGHERVVTLYRPWEDRFLVVPHMFLWYPIFKLYQYRVLTGWWLCRLCPKILVCGEFPCSVLSATSMLIHLRGIGVKSWALRITKSMGKTYRAGGFMWCFLSYHSNGKIIPHDKYR